MGHVLEPAALSLLLLDRFIIRFDVVWKHLIFVLLSMKPVVREIIWELLSWVSAVPDGQWFVLSKPLKRNEFH